MGKSAGRKEGRSAGVWVSWKEAREGGGQRGREVGKYHRKEGWSIGRKVGC